jgi:hypothetical protein
MDSALLSFLRHFLVLQAVLVPCAFHEEAFHEEASHDEAFHAGTLILYLIFSLSTFSAFMLTMPLIVPGVRGLAAGARLRPLLLAAPPSAAPLAAPWAAPSLRPRLRGRAFWPRRFG